MNNNSLFQYNPLNNYIFVSKNKSGVEYIYLTRYDDRDFIEEIFCSYIDGLDNILIVDLTSKLPNCNISYQFTREDFIKYFNGENIVIFQDYFVFPIRVAKYYEIYISLLDNNNLDIRKMDGCILVNKRGNLNETTAHEIVQDVLSDLIDILNGEIYLLVHQYHNENNRMVGSEIVSIDIGLNNANKTFDNYIKHI